MSERRERGHLMVAVAGMIAISAILATVAAQAWAEKARRDNEAEMMFRARQITLGIVRYRRARPEQPLTKLEQLMEEGPRGEYFVRKLWTDPLVRDGKWNLLYQGPGGQIVDPNATALPQGFQVGGQGDLPAAGGIGTGSGELAGLPIIGVKSRATDRPFRVYNELQDYGLWLFTIYDIVPNPGNQGQQPGGTPGAAPGVQRPGGNRPGNAPGRPGGGNRRGRR